MFRTILYASALFVLVAVMREAGLSTATMVIAGGGAFVAMLVHSLMQDA